jgi:hypothetical protein
MLKSYTFTPHLLECPGLAFILVYMITMWPMAHAVNHWTWHTNALQNEVLKTPTTKNSAIVMAASKQFLADYLLKSPTNVEGHHLVGSFLEVVMDKFSTLVSLNCRNFVS